MDPELFKKLKGRLAYDNVLIIKTGNSVLKFNSPHTHRHTHTHTHLFKGPLSGTTWFSRYEKGKNNLNFSEARDSEWQWHQLGHMQVCILLQTDNHTSTPPLCFLQARCPSCHPKDSVKALKASSVYIINILIFILTDDCNTGK